MEGPDEEGTQPRADGGLLFGGGGERHDLDRDLKEIREKNAREEGRGIPGPQ